MALALVPGELAIGEAIIKEARQRQHDPVAGKPRQPAFARRRAPQRDRDIGADDQPPALIGGVQAAADVVERGAVRRQRIRLIVDVAEFDRPGAHGVEQLVALPIDAGVADRAARVVPDDEPHRARSLSEKVRNFPLLTDA